MNEFEDTVGVGVGVRSRESGVVSRESRVDSWLSGLRYGHNSVRARRSSNFFWPKLRSALCMAEMPSGQFMVHCAANECSG